jgi:hypothetical protein
MISTIWQGSLPVIWTEHGKLLSENHLSRGGGRKHAVMTFLDLPFDEIAVGANCTDPGATRSRTGLHRNMEFPRQQAP